MNVKLAANAALKIASNVIEWHVKASKQFLIIKKHTSGVYIFNYVTSQRLSNDSLE